MERDERVFDGAERAADAAHHVRDRVHRRFRRHDRSGSPFWGVVIIAIGVAFLLDNLNIVDARFLFRNFWPLAMVLWGGYHVVNGPHTSSRIVGACVMAFGGLLLGDRLFGWDVDVWDIFWPVMLIVFGIHVFFNSRRFDSSSWRNPSAVPPLPDLPPIPNTETDGPTQAPPAPPIEGRVDASASFKETAILAGIERRNVSQAFRGGDITAIFGGVEIDLSGCRMAAGEAYIDVLVMLGGVELRIPREWTVESRVTALLAGVEDRSAPPVTDSAPRLIIRGNVLLGGVEIKN